MSLTLFDVPPVFGGSTYDPKLDQDRLTGQLKAVRDYMLGHGGWRTLKQIAQFCGASEASVSARLRDLRKPEFGSLTVERQRVKETGLFRYKVTR